MRACPFGLGAQTPGPAFEAHLAALAVGSVSRGVAGPGDQVVGAVGDAEFGHGPQPRSCDAQGGGVVGLEHAEDGLDVFEGGDGVAVPQGVFGGQAA
ncbi:hypothetical protein GCM10020219_017230 [Nonomuraea dietziae]